MVALKAWIDGACAPINPGGIATYGLVVYKEKECLHRDYKVVGKGPNMSNNVAEYAALIALLDWLQEEESQWARTDGLDLRDYLSLNLVVHSDSNLLVQQMQGVFKVKKGLYLSYYLKAKTLFDDNSHWKDRIVFKWVSRELNTEADNLSKRALGS